MKLVLLLCGKNQIYQGNSKNYYLSLIWFFDKQVIVPEYCITELGQNHVSSTCDSITLNDNFFHFWTKPLDNFFTRLLLSKFETISDKDNLDNKLSKIDIVIEGDLGQENFRLVGEFMEI